MKVIALQSGSNGNCIYVEANGVRLLFDAGISGLRAQERLADHCRDISQVDALIISHEHQDHTRCMGVFQRKFKLPIHVTPRTLAAARSNQRLGTIEDVRFFESGAMLRFDTVTVETIPTPHDAADGVAFVIDDGTHRVGILTDLGHAFERLSEAMESLDAVVIESNYDLAMLLHGPYPEFLRQRIQGPHGHLSNDEAAELVGSSAGSRLKWVCLAHLSAENNHPEVAFTAHRRVWGDRWPLFLAGRHAATEVLEVGD